MNATKRLLTSAVIAAGALGIGAGALFACRQELSPGAHSCFDVINANENASHIERSVINVPRSKTYRHAYVKTVNGKEAKFLSPAFTDMACYVEGDKFVIEVYWSSSNDGNRKKMKAIGVPIIAYTSTSKPWKYCYIKTELKHFKYIVGADIDGFEGHMIWQQ